MYNKDMKMEKGRVKGFTIVETMLFLALTGLMLVGALVGIGTNLARQRYKDSVQDVVSMIRNQYDYVTRVQIDKRKGEDMCEMIDTGAVFTGGDKNLGRGRSKCDIYGVAIVFGLQKPDDPAAGAIVQSTSILGKDISALEIELRKSNPQKDPQETITAMDDLILLQTLKLNNLIERNMICEPVNVLERKMLNWGAKIEDVKKGVAKKGIVLIIRSPRDGTVHTYTYDYSDKENIGVPDYSTLSGSNVGCDTFTASSVDINDLLGEEPAKFTSTQDFKLCITSDDLTGTYGKRRMIKIAADGHNSSAVSLIDEESEEDACDD